MSMRKSLAQKLGNAVDRHVLRPLAEKMTKLAADHARKVLADVSISLREDFRKRAENSKTVIEITPVRVEIIEELPARRGTHPSD